MFRRTSFWPALMPTRWILNLATLFRLGNRLPAPGTWGSIAGLVFYVLIFHSLHPFFYLLFLLLFTWFAVGICGEAEVRLERRDPPEVILDEFIAIPYCFLGLQGVLTVGTTWFWAILGILIFRFFDIFKPLGIYRTQNLPNGLGVVADDVVAALVTCTVLHVLVYFLGPVPF